MLNDKKSLRQTFKAKRRTITATQRAQAGQSLLASIEAQSWYQPAKNFALYRAMPEEIETQALIQFLWSAHKNCFLPKITPENTLLFAHYTAQTPLIPNRFGIPEPPAEAPVCALSDLEVIFMPLLTFDEAGHRLGMGAGFYDKTLANLNQQKKRPLLIGLAYELQKADTIPHDVWDVRLDGVVTEQSVYTF